MIALLLQHSDRGQQYLIMRNLSLSLFLSSLSFPPSPPGEEAGGGGAEWRRGGGALKFGFRVHGVMDRFEGEGR